MPGIDAQTLPVGGQSRIVAAVIGDTCEPGSVQLRARFDWLLHALGAASEVGAAGGSGS